MNKAKKLFDFIEDQKIVEGERFNSKYIQLSIGEHTLIEVLNEVNQLRDILQSWKEDNWNKVTAMDRDHKEIISLKK